MYLTLGWGGQASKNEIQDWRDKAGWVFRDTRDGAGVFYKYPQRSESISETEKEVTSIPQYPFKVIFLHNNDKSASKIT